MNLYNISLFVINHFNLTRAFIKTISTFCVKHIAFGRTRNLTFIALDEVRATFTCNSLTHEFVRLLRKRYLLGKCEPSGPRGHSAPNSISLITEETFFRIMM